MLVLVAVDAQQLPVAAIRRVVIMVVVAMMHRELLQIVAGELARATGTDPRVELQRPLAIALLALRGILSGLGDNAVQAMGVGSGYGSVGRAWRGDQYARGSR